MNFYAIESLERVEAPGSVSYWVGYVCGKLVRYIIFG